MEDIIYTNADGITVKILMQGNHIVIDDPRDEPTNQEEFLARSVEYDALVEEAKSQASQ
jgi:hypothetical protein